MCENRFAAKETLNRHVRTVNMQQKKALKILKNHLYSTRDDEIMFAEYVARVLFKIHS